MANEHLHSLSETQLGDLFAGSDSTCSIEILSQRSPEWEGVESNVGQRPAAAELAAGIAQAAREGRIPEWDNLPHDFEPTEQPDGGILTCCPAHNDHDPSLLVSDRVDQNGARKTLVYCRGGCGQDKLIKAIDRLGLWSCGPEQIEALRDEAMRLLQADCKPKAPRQMSVAVVPVPRDAPPPPKSHFQLGVMTKCWEYRNAKGELVFNVVRFDPNPEWTKNYYQSSRDVEKPNGKTFRPQSYRAFADGTTRWAWLAPLADIPLYNSQLLTTNSVAKVIVTEGEKAADAAQRIFPDQVAVTWYSGARAVKRASWDALNGREVLIWPDHDEAGSSAANAIVESLRAIACKSISLLDTAELAAVDPRHPDGPKRQAPDKWDAADAEAEWTNFTRFSEEVERHRKEIAADAAAGTVVPNRVTLEDFRAYMPMHMFIYLPTREMWPASSINARFPPLSKTMSASDWLDQNRPVEQMTWAPGEPTLIADRLVAHGGWVPRSGVTCFNLYRPPSPYSEGDATQAGPWLDHVRNILPDDAEHIIKWLAHRVQRPQEKINHALVIGGGQGIGKDTILEPVKRAVGPWNFEEVSPQQLIGRFNGFVKSVILRVSEARDLGDIDRFQFYDHMKVYTAAPPDVLRVDEKHLREHYVFNCCGVIITTNHKSDGIYLPADDRRHYVAWSDLTKSDFPSQYWNELYRWYEAGGYGHVAAYLRGLDLSMFDPKAPPPKTAAFWEIADANRAPEDAELADALDSMGGPDAVTLSQIRTATMANHEFNAWLGERKNRRAIPYRLEKCGYVAIRNTADKADGQWRVSGSRVTIYAKKSLSYAERVKAAAALAASLSR